MTVHRGQKPHSAHRRSAAMLCAASGERLAGATRLVDSVSCHADVQFS